MSLNRKITNSARRGEIRAKRATRHPIGREPYRGPHTERGPARLRGPGLSLGCRGGWCWLPADHRAEVALALGGLLDLGVELAVLVAGVADRPHPVGTVRLRRIGTDLLVGRGIGLAAEELEHVDGAV